ncbi:hypothetical protein GCM10008909_10230 [Hathewaya limosa]|uniref:prenyltransferase/squalene oxidase repeat-containing protein n=1 Tax=Hathewaya limosa TaxID=1536 RepID=UPI0031D90765
MKKKRVGIIIVILLVVVGGLWIYQNTKKDVATNGLENQSKKINDSKKKEKDVKDQEKDIKPKSLYEKESKDKGEKKVKESLEQKSKDQNIKSDDTLLSKNINKGKNEINIKSIAKKQNNSYQLNKDKLVENKINRSKYKNNNKNYIEKENNKPKEESKKRDKNKKRDKEKEENKKKDKDKEKDKEKEESKEKDKDKEKDKEKEESKKKDKDKEKDKEKEESKKRDKDKEKDKEKEESKEKDKDKEKDKEKEESKEKDKDKQENKEEVGQEVDVDTLIEETVESIKSSNEFSEWDIITLKVLRADKVLNEIEDKKQDILNNVYNDLRSQGNNYSLLNYVKSTLVILSCDENPYKFHGINLVEKLRDMVNKKDKHINAELWGVLTLEILEEDYNKQDVIDYLIKEQKEDGGFALLKGMHTSEELPDLTAMAICALDIAGKDSSDSIMIKGDQFLKKSLARLDQYKNEQNSESLAQILMASVCLNNDINEYKVNNKNILQNIMDYKHPSGYFKHVLEEDEGNRMATQQVLMALGFKKYGTNAYKNLRPLNHLPKPDVDEKDKTENKEDKTENKEDKTQKIEIKIDYIKATIDKNNGGEVIFENAKEFEKISLIIFDVHDNIAYINDLKLGSKDDRLKFNLDKGKYRGIIKLQGGSKVNIPTFEIDK